MVAEHIDLIEERKSILIFRTEHGEYQEVEKMISSPKQLADIIKSITKEGNHVVDVTVYKRLKKK